MNKKEIIKKLNSEFGAYDQYRSDTLKPGYDLTVGTIVRYVKSVGKQIKDNPFKVDVYGCGDHSVTPRFNMRSFRTEKSKLMFIEEFQSIIEDDGTEFLFEKIQPDYYTDWVDLDDERESLGYESEDHTKKLVNDDISGIHISLNNRAFKIQY